MIHALLPAAGYSRRLGQPKLALPLNGKTILEQVLATLRQAGIEKSLLVLAPHVAFLEPIAVRMGAAVCLLPQATPDMRATIEQGLAWMQTHWHPEPEDHWLLLPPDHPTLSPRIVLALDRALQSHSDRTIAIPTYEGKRGHPALISWSHVRGLASYPSHLGLNTFLRQFAVETFEVVWPTPEVLLDLDTPEDYQRLIESGTADRIQ